MNRTTWIGAAAVTGALALAGCGGGSSSGSGSGSGGSGASSTSSSSTPTSSSGTSSSGALKLAADPSGKLMFDKKTLSAKAGKVTIDFSNSSGIPHAVAVEGNGVGKDGKTITSGADSLTVDLKPGKYTFFCPVDSHRQAGMQGTLTVK